jgi:hypothetical protein
LNFHFTGWKITFFNFSGMTAHGYSTALAAKLLSSRDSFLLWVGVQHESLHSQPDGYIAGIGSSTIASG